MINPQAVQSFLDRTDLFDSALCKDFSDEQLDARLAKLKPAPVFAMPPSKHQKVCFLLGAKFPAYALWPDPGGRKTAISLTLIQWRIARGDFERALVLVPYGTMLEEWAKREAPKHAPDLCVLAVTGSKEARYRIFWESEADVVVCTYAAFLNYLSDRTDEGQGLLRSKKKCQAFLDRYGCIVGDEFHFAKSHATLTFKILKFLRLNGLAYLYELTGTPFEEPQDLWSQFYLIDFGETLGATLGLFRSAFFTSKRAFFGGFEHTFKKGLRGTLNRFIANRSIRYESEEFEDLPPVTGGLISGGDLLIRRVKIPDTTRAYYDAVVREIRDAQGNHEEMENAWHRMRRLSSGYALPKDDVGEEHPLVFKENPKLEALKELLASIPMGRQVIVFCFYQFTGQLLLAELSKEWKVGRIFGGQPAKKQNAVITNFLDGRTHILLASDAAAFGLNLQCSNYIIFFETTPSSIKRRQMEKRLHRGSQTHHVWIYDLVAKKTIDEKLLESLKEGSNLFTAILSGKQSV